MYSTLITMDEDKEFIVIAYCPLVREYAIAVEGNMVEGGLDMAGVVRWLGRRKGRQYRNAHAKTRIVDITGACVANVGFSPDGEVCISSTGYGINGPVELVLDITAARNLGTMLLIMQRNV